MPAVTYALMMVSYTVINVPYSAMLGVISPSPRTRTVASTYRFVGAFGAAFLISLFVRPLVEIPRRPRARCRGFQLTMAIFAVVSVVLILITFATTKERVTPPPQQKTNVARNWGNSFSNWPWVVLLITSIFSNDLLGAALGQHASSISNTCRATTPPPSFWGLDRTTVFLTSGALGLVLGTMCLGSIARKVDKKYYAAALSLVTGLCFLAFFFIPKGQFGLHGRGEHAGPVLRRPDFRADLGDVCRRGRLRGVEIRPALHGPDLLGVAFCHQDRHRRRGLPAAIVSRAVSATSKARTQTATSLLGITLTFSLSRRYSRSESRRPVIYPLNQKRVDEIEQELAARRAAATPEIKARMTIRNPILPGFNPDPSIVRVGDDYYIATSTFEWFPGVQIHHSRDLVHWRLLTRPLRRASQLNMLGDPDSCGIWAPCLTHADGLFWLIYTDVKRFGRTTVGGASGASMRDFHNYLVTSPRIDGDWSDPVPSQQQRLRSVAVSRRRRPQVSR